MITVSASGGTGLLPARSRAVPTYPTSPLVVVTVTSGVVLVVVFDELEHAGPDNAEDQRGTRRLPRGGCVRIGESSRVPPGCCRWRAQYDFGRPSDCWATKLRTISRLTGAMRRSRTMPHRSARPYSRRHAVAAVGLDRGVERVQAGLGGRVLRHVGGLARGDAVVGVVVHPRRLRRHQARELDLDLRDRERVRDALVAADRHAPHLALVRVRGARGRARTGRCRCRSTRS